jgi:signal transduction histidine kinase
VAVSSARHPQGTQVPQRSGLAAIAAVICVGLWALAVGLVVANAPVEQRAERGLLEALIVGVPLVAGLATLRSAGARRFSVMLLGAGAAWSLSALAETSDSLAYSAGRVAAWLIFPLLVWLMLSFPTGRFARGVDRGLFGGVTAVIALLYIVSALFVEAYPQYTPWATCRLDCPSNAFLILDAEPNVMADVVAPLRELLGALLLIGVTARLAWRTRAASPVRRRVLSPVLIASAASTATLVAFFVVRRTSSNAEAIETVGTIWSLSVPGVAFAFMIGLLRRRAIAGDMLARLSVALSRPLHAGELRSRLATALDDPALDVLLPDEVPGRWRDTHGRIASRWAAPGRVVTPIGDEAGVVAALVHDAVLREDEDVLDAVRALVLATVRHDRVTTQLATSLNALEDSRKRIARAADIERSRIERDLHDGAQQRLIGLRIKLSLAEELTQTDPTAGALAVHELGDEIDRTLDELRALAHGVYPSVLSDRGLGDALRSATAEVGMPVHMLTHAVSRQPAEVETAVYFTCLEAMQNASKHAHGATALWLTLHEGRDLVFEVRDDGPGFALPAGEFNGGLRNMRDRIEAIGGRLTIDSGPGRGTRIIGVVPLS